MFLYDMARKVNAYRKFKKKMAAGRNLSPVRRIERTAPLGSGRFVAMTFDDGPCAAQPNPPVGNAAERLGLTEELLQILDSYGARGTFDVIGTTGENYPDKEGRKDDFTWSGVSYDHYPQFGRDKLAGVMNQPQLAKKIAAGGHELANHGYRHMLFGPMKLVYGKRICFNTLKEVIDDLGSLDRLVLAETGYKMSLSRPPHYIDRIPDGYSSYDAYRYMNYQYLAASFDAGGWKPSSGNYGQDVKAMTDLIEGALLKDPGILNGQIIFQKDGFNMSLESPVADALDKCLRHLTDAGYKVVTASELIRMSPFEDIDDSDPCFEPVRKLTAAGFVTGYRNNTFQPDRLITGRELAVMTTPPGILLDRYRKQVDAQFRSEASAPKPADVFTTAIEYAGGKYDSPSVLKCLGSDQPITVNEFADFLSAAAAGSDIGWNPGESAGVGEKPSKPGSLRRRDVIKALAEIDLKLASEKSDKTEAGV